MYSDPWVEDRWRRRGVGSYCFRMRNKQTTESVWYVGPSLSSRQAHGEKGKIWSCSLLLTIDRCTTLNCSLLAYSMCSPLMLSSQVTAVGACSPVKEVQVTLLGSRRTGLSNSVKSAGWAAISLSSVVPFFSIPCCAELLKDTRDAMIYFYCCSPRSCFPTWQYNDDISRNFKTPHVSVQDRVYLECLAACWPIIQWRFPMTYGIPSANHRGATQIESGSCRSWRWHRNWQNNWQPPEGIKCQQAQGQASTSVNLNSNSDTVGRVMEALDSTAAYAAILQAGGLENMAF